MSKYDDMSFSKAFAAARKEKGSGKTFTWRGDSYTTNYKEEKESTSSKAPKTSPKPPKGRSSDSKDSGQEEKAEATRRATRSNDKIIRMASDAIEKDDGMERGPSTRGSRRPKGKTLNGVTLEEFKSMTGPERIRKGLPLTLAGFKQDLRRGENTTPTSTSGRSANRNSRGGSNYNKGGMVKSGKKDYKKSGMFYKSGSPRGYK